MERKYRKKSNLINSTGYTPGYASENNPMNIIPSSDITMKRTPYPVYGQPLDQFGNPIAAPTYMEPGQDYNYGKDTSYVAEVPAYKDGGKKQAWVSHKIGILMGEGRPQKQAIAIAYSMWEQNHEDGGYQLPEYQAGATTNFGQKPNGFSFYNRPPDFGTTIGYDPKIDPSKYGFGADSQLSENSLTAGEDWKKNNPLPQGIFASNLSDDATKDTTAKDTTATNPNGIHQFYNPYGDVGMGDALYFGGQEFAKGNNWKGAAGVGLGLLKGTKDFLAGMGNQKRQDTIMKSYNENQRKNMTGENRAVAMKNGGYYQDGGENLTKAYTESGQDTTEPQDWYAQNPPGFNLPVDEAPAKSATTQKEVWQVWEEKTGKPWREAKKLGYTDGSEKDNLKLLSELNDPRFKASNLRGSSLKTTVKKKQEVDNKVKKEIEKAKKTLSYSEYMKTLPKSGKSQGDITEVKNYDNYGVVNSDNYGLPIELLGNPLQAMAHYAKYGDMPASGFSKYDKNAYDQVIGTINPAYWMNAAVNTMDYAENKEYKKAAREALDILPALRTLKAAKFVPVGRGAEAGSELATVGNRAVSAAPKMTTAVGQARRAAPLRNYFEQALPAGREATQLGQGALRLPQGAPRLGQGPQQYGQLSFGFEQGGYFQEGGEQDQMGGMMPMAQEQPAGQDAQIQQVMQQVAQMLQQGANPQQVVQQLIQSGIPQDQATQIVQAAMQQSGDNPEMKCGGKMYQEGGETETEEPGENEQAEGESTQQEQIEDQVETALKQGADPQQVLQQLVQMGMPEQEAVQMIQEILQELQNGEEQEAPEEGEPKMENGGNYLEALKGKVIKNYTYNKNTGNYDVEFQ